MYVRCWMHSPAIHTASHVDREKGVAWFSISVHACGSVPISYGSPLSIVPPSVKEYIIIVGAQEKRI